ncbi:hypothetical protein EZV62_027275 [Acer yangbiense]|uniref:Uncharacterized protein n=1 Tax=Acer yangbiense TaxID=1000413 RepID=A0A5C7GT98_9ROSI|nr:hypothetical protein EZV62_027275 [Acer yangbiense]
MSFSWRFCRIIATTPRNRFIEKVLCFRETYSWTSPALHSVGRLIHQQRCSVTEEQLDPFSLVADELSIITKRLRSVVGSEVPKLASAAGYFFKAGVEGKMIRPMVLLLMATALNVPRHELPTDGVQETLTHKLRTRHQYIAEVTEMIHVASLIHDDVFDDADTRRGVGSLSFVMGNKLAVLSANFLLSRAFATLVTLKNTEVMCVCVLCVYIYIYIYSEYVISLMATSIQNLVAGEIKQMTVTAEQRYSMECYMQKTYYKTASLVSNSCKAIALVADQTEEVAMLAFEYGKNLGLAFQLIDDILDFTGKSASLGKASLTDIKHGIITAPILFAIEEFPQLSTIIDRGFDNPANIDTVLEYLGKSHGIQRTMELAMKHANLAAAAITSLPESNDVDVTKSRKALVNLTQKIITRNK